MEGSRWSLLVSQPLEAVRPASVAGVEPTHFFLPQMMHSQDSSMALVATLHRIDDATHAREMWSIIIENGVPQLHKER